MTPRSRTDGSRERHPLVCRAPDAARTGETIAHIANRTAAECPDADIALVLEQTEPPPGWLECLGEAAGTDSTIATVSALPGGAGETYDVELALLRANHSLVSTRDEGPVRIPLVVGPYVYIRRPAFDLLAGLDETLPSSACAVADFGLRAAAYGLANLATARLIAPPQEASTLAEDDRAELARRFPFLWAAAGDPPSGALEHRLLDAGTALRGLSVTIDARSLSGHTGGTQVYVLHLIQALARTGEIDIRALVGPDPEAIAAVRAIDGTSVLTYEEALASPGQSDVVHRPQQVFTVDDLELLRPLGKRLVITHLDLIAYHNPTYFPGPEEWRRHVRATRIAFDAADRLLFASAHALADARREDLIDSERAGVVPLGVDPAPEPDLPAMRPEALADRDEPFLLCIGADYAHKNRPFALEVAAELRAAHAWSGVLVLAGSHVDHGSSAQAERRVLASRSGLQDAAIDVGPVSEPQRRWLMRHAAAVIYPTVLEGFGLVPFEAAAVGVPCLYASQSSLGDLLPAEQATLDGWNAHRAAARAAELLHDAGARQAHVRALAEASRRYEWSVCAERTIAAYRRALAAPARSSARRAWEALEREGEIVRLDRAVSDMRREHAALLEDIGEDGLALVGPHGLLSQADRRALLAMAARAWLRRPLFAAGRMGYRLTRLTRR